MALISAADRVAQCRLCFDNGSNLRCHPPPDNQKLFSTGHRLISCSASAWQGSSEGKVARLFGCVRNPPCKCQRTMRIAFLLIALLGLSFDHVIAAEPVSGVSWASGALGQVQRIDAVA